ncbi:anti-sigma F factor antagonist [Clostridium hydrogeniformans]|uniref:anti-sigma F factor antagonist n=1 Tax=Clostridium hydrogeniformans TaxID=349933 RepID=UPI00048526BD|nr:anti-sigma F factor antagonist [Clostridium hydrogeniformans]
MYVKFDKISDKLVVTLLGELDHHSSEEVRNKIDNNLDEDNIKKLILNFSGVTFMDSSGIGVVIGRYKKLQPKNGVVCVTEVNNRVKKVFEISGMYKIIPGFETVEEALNSI